ncbi:hypothetical protein HYH03_018680 [Edaphochlamys debaryana]|uniref:Uncharacterized protein n=1 Tax=Edaphochlamys debaryana TaxID=47281 RepID=A0A835XFF0_9CHLO|nr:hypothetical protein HYH03_018680 [Edaphochlamys debaryana]|eukprot:KAG2482384.1 hypothetical protein HYH03_018680 [Edaphochlamys debaryana]
MELLSADTAAAVATAFPCLRALRLVQGDPETLCRAAVGLALLISGSGSGQGPAVFKAMPAYTSLARRFPAAAASGLLGPGLQGPAPQLGPPALANLQELCLHSEDGLRGTQLASVLSLVQSLPALTHLELTAGVNLYGLAVHASALRPLSRLQSLRLPRISLKLDGDLDGLTAMSALTELRVASIAYNGAAEWEFDRRRPTCTLPPRLEVLALGWGKNSEDDDDLASVYGISDFTGAPGLKCLDLTKVTASFEARYITQLTSLQELLLPNAQLLLVPGISKLQALTKLVAEDLVGRQYDDEADDGAVVRVDEEYDLPPALPALTLTCSNPFPDWGPLRKVWGTGLRATEQLTLLQVPEGEADCYLRPESLTGLVGLTELVAPTVDLVACGSLASLTALTLMSFRRLLQEGADQDPDDDEAAPEPLPPSDLELPPNLLLLRLGARGPYQPHPKFAARDFFSDQSAGQLTCAHGPARIELHGPLEPGFRAGALLGLAGLRELHVPLGAMPPGAEGLAALAALSAVRVVPLPSAGAEAAAPKPAEA